MAKMYYLSLGNYHNNILNLEKQPSEMFCKKDALKKSF